MCRRALLRRQGDRRLYFWDPLNERQLDVFLDRVELCHAIDLRDRLDIDADALAPADLLLMKLQIVETNEKDLLDMVALLTDQPFAEDGIELDYIAGLTAPRLGAVAHRDDRGRTRRRVRMRARRLRSGPGQGLAAARPPRRPRALV